jgi:hypothetical protein
LLVIASRNEHPLLADQMHANARLVAAAPELLGLCSEWVSAWEKEEFDPSLASRMRAAIAKATGEK